MTWESTEPATKGDAKANGTATKPAVSTPYFDFEIRCDLYPVTKVRVTEYICVCCKKRGEK